IPQIFEIAKERGVGMVTYDPKDNLITGTKTDKYMELEARINRRDIHQVQDFMGAIKFPVNKCLISGEPEVLAPLTEELQKRYYGVLNIYRSEPFFLEIMPPLVDKAHALERLLPSLGIGRDECVCCGDGYNDITMLQYAGLGVAMANAQLEVREAADIITLSNDEDGLVPVICTYFLDAK
ncbi:MAG: HAD-IIB family hydrolase, partial [Lachnospiraceae bacterium]|nr:HAD-IIB family hydrolase [Lachnospiraceae bacterium]